MIWLFAVCAVLATLALLIIASELVEIRRRTAAADADRAIEDA